MLKTRPLLGRGLGWACVPRKMEGGELALQVSGMRLERARGPGHRGPGGSAEQAELVLETMDVPKDFFFFFGGTGV